ncbi:MAG: hypothetical protein WEA79_00235 [Balneolaceae bacterium]
MMKPTKYLFLGLPILAILLFQSCKNDPAGQDVLFDPKLDR